ncbi:hypothetical protein EJ03DRAFT_197679 [Teratosphaeria nubilosa]|uniref:Uncharacterized protein n=1 Tax=Teratosphaeria nubilosa TaxID=161662 RepID=A0A6G1KYN3_9PEZI|nr:hypothetical protein EJ03DRAFT_197679 [Teratosphaeria nubilosa]
MTPSAALCANNGTKNSADVEAGSRHKLSELHWAARWNQSQLGNHGIRMQHRDRKEGNDQLHSPDEDNSGGPIAGIRLPHCHLAASSWRGRLAISASGPTLSSDAGEQVISRVLQTVCHPSLCASDVVTMRCPFQHPKKPPFAVSQPSTFSKLAFRLSPFPVG